MLDTIAAMPIWIILTSGLAYLILVRIGFRNCDLSNRGSKEILRK
jgi:hypothetical protein